MIFSIQFNGYYYNLFQSIDFLSGEVKSWLVQQNTRVIIKLVHVCLTFWNTFHRLSKFWMNIDKKKQEFFKIYIQIEPKRSLLTQCRINRCKINMNFHKEQAPEIMYSFCLMFMWEKQTKYRTKVNSRHEHTCLMYTSFNQTHDIMLHTCSVLFLLKYKTHRFNYGEFSTRNWTLLAIKNKNFPSIVNIEKALRKIYR